MWDALWTVESSFEVPLRVHAPDWQTALCLGLQLLEREAAIPHLKIQRRPGGGVTLTDRRNDSTIDVEGLDFRDNAMGTDGVPHEAEVDGLFVDLYKGSLRLVDAVLEDNEVVLESSNYLYLDGLLVNAYVGQRHARSRPRIRSDDLARIEAVQ